MTTFWIVLAILYAILAAVSIATGRRLDKKVRTNIDKLKKDYGFNTYDVYDLLHGYLRWAGWINIVGFVLASAAAVISALS